MSTTIGVPLGSDIKEAARRLPGWVLQTCPFCGAENPRAQDRWVRVVPVGNGAGADVEMIQKRYVCRRRGRRITPVPDCRDCAIEECLGGRLTYQLSATTSCASGVQAIIEK